MRGISCCCCLGGSRSIVCELCSHACYELVDYTHHFKRAHLSQFTIECARCGRGFWKTIALRQHRCAPELREENLRLREEKKAEALRASEKIRARRERGGGERGRGAKYNNIYSILITNI